MHGTRAAVGFLLAEGASQADVARRLGVSKATVCRHAKALGIAADERFRRRYDWEAVQRYYDAGHSIRECMERFGFAKQTWHNARLRGDVTTRPHGMPLDELLGGPRNRSHVKGRLIRLGLKEPRCERCGIDSWQGRPLSLALHHRNGDGRDNRLENLELLCPNCHSQTENFAGRNRRAVRAA